jgi:hypothetical protein
MDKLQVALSGQGGPLEVKESAHNVRDIHNRVLMYIVTVRARALGTPSSCPDHDAFATNCLRLDYLDVSQPRVLALHAGHFVCERSRELKCTLDKNIGPIMEAFIRN